MTVRSRIRSWPWLTLQIVAANIAVVMALAGVWFFVFKHQSSVYSDRLMSTFNIEPGQLHAMYVADVERQLWASVIAGVLMATVAAIGLAFLIVRPLRSLAQATERLKHGDYSVRSTLERGEVGRLAENFNALAMALQQEENRRAQFMADLSHELRTPITSLRGYTEGLEDGIFRADQDFFNLMTGELHHLTALTDTIESMKLDAVNISGQQPAAETTIGELLEEAKIRWESRFLQRKLYLDLLIYENLESRRFAVPVTSLRQIVDNLLSNMFRYASVDGPCRIEVAKAKRANFIELAFSNDAPDIDDDAVPFLFDRFYRVSTSRTRSEREHPRGLGLSIVKQLCLCNRGNVTASLDSPRLTISVDLPLGPIRGSKSA